MTPLERAADALRRSDICGFHEAENKDYVAMARAALTAIREPSEGMIEAVGEVDLPPRQTWDATARAWFTVMIDAALAEGE